MEIRLLRSRMWTCALVTLLAFCAGASAQVVMEEIGPLQESYAAAMQSYQSVQFPQAITGLNPLIETLTRWEQGEAASSLRTRLCLNGPWSSGEPARSIWGRRTWPAGTGHV